MNMGNPFLIWGLAFHIPEAHQIGLTWIWTPPFSWVLASRSYQRTTLLFLWVLADRSPEPGQSRCLLKSFLHTLWICHRAAKMWVWRSTILPGIRWDTKQIIAICDFGNVVILTFCGVIVSISGIWVSPYFHEAFEMAFSHELVDFTGKCTVNV